MPPNSHEGGVAVGHREEVLAGVSGFTGAGLGTIPSRDRPLARLFTKVRLQPAPYGPLAQRGGKKLEATQKVLGNLWG